MTLKRKDINFKHDQIKTARDNHLRTTSKQMNTANIQNLTVSRNATPVESPNSKTLNQAIQFNEIFNNFEESSAKKFKSIR